MSSPAKVTEQLTGPNSQPVVHIPLPGWVWNLERRVQWREALDHWRKIENLVILVELPPAGMPEAVLLGSNLPNLSGWPTAAEPALRKRARSSTTLRHARCNLVGAVLNREMAPPLRNRFSRWIGCFAALAVLAPGMALAQAGNPLPSATSATSAGPSEPAAGTNLYFSIVSPSQRAPWQQHLTLGPGDVLDFGLYAQPDLNRTDVTIGPDGRISYLEAQDVLATGLTIDELRAKLDQELSKYRRGRHDR